ncbi:MAG: mannitol operon transcriptional antiterminator [Cellvibrionaceae bacterium]
MINANLYPDTSSVMISLTTRQRDLLRQLLESDETVVVADLAKQMNLSPRQVSYGLKGVRSWLEQRNILMQVTPGIGVELICSTSRREELLQDLKLGGDYALVLSAGQRHQLVSLNLLTATEPIILHSLQDDTQVSRTTILKDIEVVEEWLEVFNLKVEKRPNFGTWIEGGEWKIRQALTALLWGDTLFEDPIFHMSHMQGLEFSLESDASLLPVLQQVTHLIEVLDFGKMTALVASAEAEMGGRFTDHEVLHLTLALAVQMLRIDSGKLIKSSTLNFEEAEKIGKKPIWVVAKHLLKMVHPMHKMDPKPETYAGYTNEINTLAVLLLAGSKNERWPGDLETEKEFDLLISRLLQLSEEAYELQGLAHDVTLRDGLIANVIPACLRRQYDLWSPVSRQSNQLSAEKYAFEHQIAGHLAAEVEKHTTYKLPKNEVNNLALLLRAAWVRERPHLLREVIVVCPSGMATAQLLVARLKARFPRLGNLNVVSMREISRQSLSQTDLVITTVPLSSLELPIKVIQVHPLLLPEDIATITQWLS